MYSKNPIQFGDSLGFVYLVLAFVIQDGVLRRHVSHFAAAERARGQRSDSWYLSLN